MSDDVVGKSHTRAWVLGILACPVLYVLCWPWISIPLELAGHLRVHQVCGMPYTWLVVKTPLRGPLTSYIHWCWSMTYPNYGMKEG
jgi:hypothetical protein